MTRRAAVFAASAAMLIQFTKHDLTALQTLGCEIHMICNLQQETVSAQAMEAFQKQFPKLIWHDLPFSDGAHTYNQNRRQLARLQELLTKLKPAVLHCHGALAGKYGRMAAAPLHIPVFYTAHDFRLYPGCRLRERLRYGAAERRLAADTCRLFTVCPEDTAYAQKHLSVQQVTEMPYEKSLNGAYYAAPSHTRTAVRQMLHIPADHIVLLSDGSLFAEKRFRIVIQAMTRLRDLPQLHYLICGEGPDRLFLEKLVEKLHLEKRVHLLGYRTDMPDLLAAADIFCMTSRREGCGIAALEAMAAGLPLIVTKVHGTSAFQDADCAILLKGGDLVDSCAAAIRSLAENKLLRKQMGAHNRAAAARFSDEGRMMEMRQAYWDIVGHP